VVSAVPFYVPANFNELQENRVGMDTFCSWGGSLLRFSKQLYIEGIYTPGEAL
jgi:hypothetical protein